MSRKNSYQQLERNLGYRFGELALLEQALTHRSHSRQHNERMEFLGDALLSAFVAEELCERFPEVREGTLTRFRASLVKKESLASLAQGMGLGDSLRLGGGELKSGGRQRASILADALEAVICAVYLDSSFEQCRQVVLQWYASRFDQLSPEAEQRDPKTQLQEWLQSRQRPLPVYRLIAEGNDEKVPAGQSEVLFRIGCRIDGCADEIVAVAETRRLAEQAAAQVALERLSIDD